MHSICSPFYMGMPSNFVYDANFDELQQRNILGKRPSSAVVVQELVHALQQEPARQLGEVCGAVHVSHPWLSGIMLKRSY